MDLYISDLDGTLLNSKGKLSQRTINAINGLIESGLQFTIATARGIDTVKEILKPLNIQLPIILNNGLFIYDLKTDQVVNSHYIEEKTALEIYKILLDYGTEPLLRGKNKTKNVIYYNSCKTQHVKYFLDSKRKTSSLNVIQTKALPVENLKTYSIFTLGNKKDLKDASIFLNSTFDLGIDFYCDTYNDAFWLEINPLKATKGEAALFLKDEYKFDKIISFGDNLNDLSMFRVSHQSYGMVSGNYKIRKHVSKVIGTNNDDSVSKEIRRLFLQEENHYREIS